MARIGTMKKMGDVALVDAGQPSPTITAQPDRRPGGPGWIEPGLEPRPSRRPGKPPYRVPTMAEIRAIPRNDLRSASTFSGAGGSCLGFEMAGFHVAWANEFLPIAGDSYEANHPDTVLDRRDIRTVKGAEIIAACGGVAPDVLEGSPPCQSFSTAGTREKGWGKSIKHGDGTEQRSDDLFFEFTRLLKELQPRAFIAENVSGLVKGTAKGYFLNILKALTDCGYLVETRVLDAKWLGVPQSRQRVIFQGYRLDTGLKPSWPKPFSFFYSVRDACPWIAEAMQDNSGFTKEISFAGDAIPAITVGAGSVNSTHFTVTGEPAKGLGADEKDDEVLPANPRVAAIVTERWRGRPPAGLGVDEGDDEIMSVKPNVREKWEKLALGEQHEKHFSLSRVAPGEPHPTVAAMYGDPGVYAPVHPFEPRRMTILEVKRLCSFPDDYRLIGNFKERWARLGNSVPPLMMRAVAQEVARVLLEGTPGSGGQKGERRPGQNVPGSPPSPGEA